MIKTRSPLEFDTLFTRYQHELEDFWGRRENQPRFWRKFSLLGRPVQVFSNEAGILAAVDFSQPLYSIAPLSADTPFYIQLVVRAAPIDPGPIPDDLVRHIQYTGQGTWLALQLGAWGHCQIDLAAHRAVAVLTPELAQRPDLVSSWLLNTIFNNLLKASGLSMLHATALVRNGRVLLLLAPHNSGKSTTALHLTLTGYTLLSDSQIYIAHRDKRTQLMAFPVGRIKLRQDMISNFPQLQPWLTIEQVRIETKYSVDLRRYDPALVYETAIWPTAIELCLLQRSDDGKTHLTPASQAAVLEAVMVNSLFYDTAAAWQHNFASIERLVDKARLHHLAIGTNVAEIIAAVDNLM